MDGQSLAGVKNMVVLYMKATYSTLDDILSLFEGERLAIIGFCFIMVVLIMGIFAPWLAPYDPGTMHYDDDGDLLRMSAPSLDHYFGTTHLGNDIFSQVVWGSRVSLVVGLGAAIAATFIGTNVGLISGYYGGLTDDILMRFVDIAYGIPILPLAIVLVFILSPGILNMILIISLLMWRASARVIRSEVLSHRERDYIEAAEALGASDVRILYLHIFPNILPFVVLYTAFGVAWAIIYEASISFLGFGDPNLYSWGTIMYEAYHTGGIRYAWWWAIPPGIAIMFMVMSVFFIGRALEKVTDPSLRVNNN